MPWPVVRSVAGGLFAAGAVALLSLGSPGLRGSYQSGGGNVASGQIIVQFRADLSPQQQASVLTAHGATLDRSMLVDGYAVANVPTGSEATVGESLAQSGVVATASDNPLRSPAGAPDDPYYPQQWNMALIGLSAARDLSDGTGATVAVIDTGLAYETFHDPITGKDFGRAPDLANTTIVKPCDMTVTPPADQFTCSADTHPNDDYGHGSHVTGTIAQSTNNNYGTAGIAPKAKIMPIKVCGPSGNPPKEQCADDKTADAVEYAVQNGADVINVSIAGVDPVGQTAPLRQALNDARNAGVIVVAASGNSGSGTLQYPAAISGVIAVGAVGMDEHRASYSNYGVGESENGTEHDLDIVAPGGDTATEGIDSVIWQQSYNVCTGATDYTTFPEATRCQGTSMAAAHVSGVLALIVSKFPKLSASQVRNDLKCSAEDLGDPGYDLQFGNGLVRADRALADLDHDAIPDCIDSSVSTATPTFTPFPTPIPPENDCLPPSQTPTPTPTLVPTPTGPTPTSRETSTPAPSGLSIEGTTTDSPTPTDSPPPTDTPTATPTETPFGSETPTATAHNQTDTPTPTPTPTATPEPTNSPTPRPLPCGDVDCSGFVNAADALGVLQWLTESSLVQCIGLGYVNCDGQLNAVDAVVILRHSATLPVNLPAGCTGIG